ncbi:hypothetical protein Agub_g5443 [Astrephomene gubernaculifera]|uniref:Uncharacterized protein n=1 Tax=Astrephomene gubernaculifera TaxID=47775 RepID=A0AAD3HKN0_9CHLO|nr:hypothetical protein Agub_g5443 [Astrephomene gubernaculifera]
MSTIAGSTTSALRSWEAKKPKSTAASVALGLVQQYAVPLAVLGFFVRRYLKSRKQAAKKPDAAAKGTAAAQSASARKPRREYKVKRDQEPQPLLVGEDDEEVEVQPHDNVMEAYSETEVEKAGAAASGPAGGNNTAMLQMLQQMGYRIVMPKDGSGQVFLVPPGAAGPGGQAIEEGDEEGYDEDEEGYEEGDEEEEDE